MGMSYIDQAICADIFHDHTGIETEASWWNEEAGNLPAEMVYQIEECTNGMDDANCFLSAISKGLRTILSPTNPKSWKWLVTVPADRLKSRAKLKMGFVNTVCLNQRLMYWQREIEFALMK